MKKKSSIIVVGAGPGGLTAAMLLAHQGYDVTVLEKSDRVGGRNAAIEKGGFTFDTGPTFLLMKYILDEVFQGVGRRSDDYLKFTLLEPMYRLNFTDQTVDIWSDQAKMQAEIDRHFPGNEQSVAYFHQREEKRFRALMPILQQPFDSWRNFLSRRFLSAMPWLYNGRSLYQELGRYFKDERLRLCYTFQSKYLGMSPWDCPSAFTLIPYTEHEFGIYHVEGGLNQISAAMAKVVVEEGGQIQLKQTVEQLIVESGRVVGVRLAGGEERRADHVVVNADAAWALANLVPEGVQTGYSRSELNRRRYSCSTFMIYLGLDKEFDLPHHSIYFAREYRQNVDDIFAGRVDPSDVSFYLQNASVTDKTLAPAGGSTWYVLAPVANLKADHIWDEASKQQWRAELLRQVKERTGVTDLEKHIQTELIITPQEWAADYNVFLGAVFGFSHHLNQMLLFRPHNEFEKLPGLYFVGASTHPGSGLPTIYESARITARLIVESGR